MAFDGTLYWKNNSFTNGTAKFSADSAGVLYAVLTGPLPDNLTVVGLEALDGTSGILYSCEVRT